MVGGGGRSAKLSSKHSPGGWYCRPGSIHWTSLRTSCDVVIHSMVSIDSMMSYPMLLTNSMTPDPMASLWLMVNSLVPD